MNFIADLRDHLSREIYILDILLSQLVVAKNIEKYKSRKEAFQDVLCYINNYEI